METYSFDHIQPSPNIAHVALMSGIGNAKEILDDVKKGGKKFDQMPMTLIDAKMICSKNQLLVAIHQAILRNARQINPSSASHLKTKTIHSEILWNLSLTNNIAETFRTFGLSDSTQDLLLVHIALSPSNGGPDAKDVLAKMQSIVEGTISTDGLKGLDSWRTESVELTPQRHIDWRAICKAYKLGDIGVDDVEDEGEKELLKREQIDSLATSLVAMKFVSS